MQAGTDTNLWVVLVPPKLIFSGDFTQWVMSLISLFCTLMLSIRLFCSAAIQSLLQHPPDVRCLIRIGLSRQNLLHKVRLWPHHGTVPNAALQCYTHSWCSWPLVLNTKWGAKCLSEIWRATSLPGGATTIKKHPFQKIQNDSVEIFYFPTELAVIF